MHIRLAKPSALNLGEFAKQYLMIVLSILTALGLDAWVEHTQHTNAAADASQQIEVELRANLVDIDNSLRKNTVNLQPLQQLDKAIGADIRGHLPNDAINRHILALRKQFKLSMNWPTFGMQAWNVAIANQSASWMNTNDLRRYSSAYSAQQDVSLWMAHESTVMLNAQGQVMLQAKLDLGVPVDPVEFEGILHQMIFTLFEVQQQIEQTKVTIQNALQKKAGTRGKTTA
ncbi:MAG: hypothetical protein ABI870_01675 [Rhodanobacter sp.]